MIVWTSIWYPISTISWFSRSSNRPSKWCCWSWPSDSWTIKKIVENRFFAKWLLTHFWKQLETIVLFVFASASFDRHNNRLSSKEIGTKLPLCRQYSISTATWEGYQELRKKLLLLFPSWFLELYGHILKFATHFQTSYKNFKKSQTKGFMYQVFAYLPENIS